MKVKNFLTFRIIINNFIHHIYLYAWYNLVNKQTFDSYSWFYLLLESFIRTPASQEDLFVRDREFLDGFKDSELDKEQVIFDRVGYFIFENH